MKKILLWISAPLLIIFMSSCSASKLVTNTEKSFIGNWTITDIIFSGINQSHVKAKLFDEASAACYRGSQWYFVRNNNSGSYTLSPKRGCPKVTNAIKWVISDEGGNPYFKFKRIPKGERAKNIVWGYKMKVVSNNGNKMVLMQQVPFEGKKLTIQYIFEKNINR